MSYTASDTNVDFAFGLALEAAADLWALAGEVRAKQGDRIDASDRCVVDWRGPHRDRYDRFLRTEQADAETVAAGLEDLARALAEAWSRARGEQDRINHARYVEQEKSEDSWVENTGEFFVGEDDYGAPPEDPPVPDPPDFAPTRQPIYPEFE